MGNWVKLGRHPVSKTETKALSEEEEEEEEEEQLGMERGGREWETDFEKFSTENSLRENVFLNRSDSFARTKWGEWKKINTRDYERRSS